MKNKYILIMFLIPTLHFQTHTNPLEIEAPREPNEAGNNHKVVVETSQAVYALNHQALTAQNPTLHAGITSIPDITNINSSTFAQAVSDNYFSRSKYPDGKLSFSELSLLKKAFDKAKTNDYKALNATLEDIARDRNGSKLTLDRLNEILDQAKKESPKNPGLFHGFNTKIGDAINAVTRTNLNEAHTNSAIRITTEHHEAIANSLREAKNQVKIDPKDTTGFIPGPTTETIAKLSTTAQLSQIEDKVKDYIQHEAGGTIPQDIFNYLYYKKSLFNSAKGKLEITDQVENVYKGMLKTETKYPFLKKYSLVHNASPINQRINKILFESALRKKYSTPESQKKSLGYLIPDINQKEKDEALNNYNSKHETQYTWEDMQNNTTIFTPDLHQYYDFKNNWYPKLPQN